MLGKRNSQMSTMGTWVWNHHGYFMQSVIFLNRECQRISALSSQCQWRQATARQDQGSVRKEKPEIHAEHQHPAEETGGLLQENRGDPDLRGHESQEGQGSAQWHGTWTQVSNKWTITEASSAEQGIASACEHLC